MSDTTENFVRELVDQVTELAPILEQHLEDEEGELLPHLFMADVERWSRSEIEAGRTGESEPLVGVLDHVERAVASGDQDLVDLAGASFLEHLPAAGEPGDQIRGLLGPRSASLLTTIEGG